MACNAPHAATIDHQTRSRSRCVCVFSGAMALASFMPLESRTRICDDRFRGDGCRVPLTRNPRPLHEVAGHWNRIPSPEVPRVPAATPCNDCAGAGAPERGFSSCPRGVVCCHILVPFPGGNLGHYAPSPEPRPIALQSSPNHTDLVSPSQASLRERTRNREMFIGNRGPRHFAHDHQGLVNDVIPFWDCVARLTRAVTKINAALGGGFAACRNASNVSNARVTADAAK